MSGACLLLLDFCRTAHGNALLRTVRGRCKVKYSSLMSSTHARATRLPQSMEGRHSLFGALSDAFYSTCGLGFQTVVHGVHDILPAGACDSCSCPFQPVHLVVLQHCQLPANTYCICLCLQDKSSPRIREACQTLRAVPVGAHPMRKLWLAAFCGICELVAMAVHLVKRPVCLRIMYA